MDGWMDGWVHGKTDGWVREWIDKQTQTDEYQVGVESVDGCSIYIC